MDESGNTRGIEYELAVLEEWMRIQRDMMDFALTASHPQSRSWREIVSTHITQCTRGCAGFYWESLAMETAVGCDRFYAVRFKQSRYGFLGLSPGYLESPHFPDIPKTFSFICALVLAFVEYQTLISYQLNALPPLLPVEHVERLTRREYDVLLGVIKGANDNELAKELGIEPTTVHSHRKSLYRRLRVHSAQEATLRCFTHRLIDWLDGMMPRPGEALRPWDNSPFHLHPDHTSLSELNSMNGNDHQVVRNYQQTSS